MEPVNRHGAAMHRPMEWSRQLSRGGGGVRRGRVPRGAANGQESVRQGPGTDDDVNGTRGGESAVGRARSVAADRCGRGTSDSEPRGQGRGGFLEVWWRRGSEPPPAANVNAPRRRARENWPGRLGFVLG